MVFVSYHKDFLIRVAENGFQQQRANERFPRSCSSLGINYSSSTVWGKGLTWWPLNCTQPLKHPGNETCSLRLI